jgi:hypothetical protein
MSPGSPRSRSGSLRAVRLAKAEKSLDECDLSGHTHAASAVRASRFIDEPCDRGEASRAFIGKPYGKGHSLVLAINFINREVKMRASGNPCVAREPNEVPGLNGLTDIGSTAVSRMCVVEKLPSRCSSTTRLSLSESLVRVQTCSWQFHSVTYSALYCGGFR